MKGRNIQMSMKKLIIGLVIVVGISAAASVSAAGSGNCGLGKIPFSGFLSEVKQQMGEPYFVFHEMDNDGKVEGRADSVWMMWHWRCLGK